MISSSPNSIEERLWPKISIVTPSYNQGLYLEKTILSVIEQGYPNLEYIIIDGGSTDNSVEIIKKYETHLAYWVSEKDNGQSHAINKGIKKMTGDIFNWLCSDDYLEPGSLFHIAQAFQSKSNVHCYAGRLRKFSPPDETIWFYDNMLMSTWEDTIRLRWIKQPAVFFSKQAIERMGLLNETLHYCMDLEWVCKFLFLFNQENIVEDKFLIAHYLLHESSKSLSQANGFIKENDSIVWFFAINKGLNQYADLIEYKEINKNYEFTESILKLVDKKLIERIVFFELLRKSVKIYSEQDFIFARKFLSIKHEIANLESDELFMMSFLNKYVKNSNWFLFKIKRAYLWKIKGVNVDIEQYISSNIGKY